MNLNNFFRRLDYMAHRVRSRWRRLWAPFRLEGLGHRTSHWLTYWGGRFMDGVRYPFYVLGWLFSQLLGLLTAWWSVRNFRYLIQGLPALAGLLGVIVVAAYTYFRHGDSLIERYLREARDAFAISEQKTALLCCERLALLDPDGKRPELRFMLYSAAINNGQMDRAQRILDDLAQPDRSGFPEAHLSQAYRLLKTPGKRPTPAEQRDAENHLLRVLQTQKDNPDANALLGELLMDQNRGEEAEKYLKIAATTRAGLRLKLAAYYDRVGRDADARLQRDIIIEACKRMSATDLDNIDFRLLWAEACITKGDFAAAVATLEEGLNHRNSPYLKSSISTVYLKWFQAVVTQKDYPFAKAFELLEKSLAYDLGNYSALTVLVRFTRQPGPNGDRAREAMRRLLAERGDSATLHLVLGIDAYESGRVDEARLHYQRAYELSPDMLAVGNNFAYILASSPPIDLATAQNIINQVVEQCPPNNAAYPNYRGTRGFILNRQGRYKEALADLEFSLKANNENPGTHRLIAEVYGKLGDARMRDAHLKIADGLEKVGRPAAPTPGSQ